MALVETELSGDGSRDRPAARRRRSYTAEEKRRIVQETLQSGASVSVVAQRHGINANLLFNWRRQVRQDRGGAPGPEAAGAVALLPLGVIGGVVAARPGRLRPGRLADGIEIDLPNGARVRVDAAVEACGLRRVLAALKAAW